MTAPAAPRGKTIVLLDGGMGQELHRRSVRPATPLWSAQVMLEQPDLVQAVHLDFIRAGARIITVNSYAVTPQNLSRAGKAGMFDALQNAALGAARAARAASGQNVQIAGCLPPLVATYRPDLAPPPAVCLADYRRIVDAQAGRVDLFVCEALPTVGEAHAATVAANESGKTVWTALTVDDADGTLLRSGEPVADGARAALDAGAAAVLVNCSSPEATAGALSILAGIGRPFGAYANGFVSVEALDPDGTVDVLETRDDLGPAAYADHALAWAASGAAIVGSCCEIGPAHIAELARRLSEEGYELAADIGPNRARAPMTGEDGVP